MPSELFQIGTSIAPWQMNSISCGTDEEVFLVSQGLEDDIRSSRANRAASVRAGAFAAQEGELGKVVFPRYVAVGEVLGGSVLVSMLGWEVWPMRSMQNPSIVILRAPVWA